VLGVLANGFDDEVESIAAVDLADGEESGPNAAVISEPLKNHKRTLNPSEICSLNAMRQVDLASTSQGRHDYQTNKSLKEAAAAARHRELSFCSVKNIFRTIEPKVGHAFRAFHVTFRGT
jgi:hypothetical protein